MRIHSLGSGVCRDGLLGLVGALLLALGTSAQAAFVVVPGLYTAETVTDARDDDAREAGLRNALAQVIIRVTGQLSVAGQPEGRQVIDQAESLVSQFRFEPIEPEPDADAPPPDDDAEPPPVQYRLTASFVPGAVDNALRNAGLPVWPPRRPRTLVWLVTDSGQGIVDDSDKQRRAGALLDAAQARGLPLEFPLMDLEDRRSIDAADIRGGFDDRIRAASTRYDTAEVLVGHISRSGSLRTARWTLLDPRQGGQRWTQTTRSTDAALTEGIAELADRLVQRYAGGGNGPRAAIDVAVRGITGLDDYGRVLNMFQRLTAVDDTLVHAAHNDVVVFRLMSGATVANLARAIDVERVIVRDETRGGGVLGRPYGALNNDPAAIGVDQTPTRASPGDEAELPPVGQSAQLHYRMR